MRFVRLSEEERKELEKLYKTSPNSVVRSRSLSLLYSNQRRSIKEVSNLVGISRRSFERLLKVWESAVGEEKYKALSIAEGRGAKIKLTPVKDLLEDLVKEHSRNLNPVLSELETNHNIKVCKLTLQNFLKDAKL